jgi:hypothetical protein
VKGLFGGTQGPEDEDGPECPVENCSKRSTKVLTPTRYWDKISRLFMLSLRQIPLLGFLISETMLAVVNTGESSAEIARFSIVAPFANAWPCLMPLKNGEIALWPNTRVVKCKFEVSQTRNVCNDEYQRYHILLTFVS